MRIVFPLLGLFGCAPAVPDLPLTVLDRQSDGSYALSVRDVPELTDPFRVQGEVAAGFRGGAFVVDPQSNGSALLYREGASLRVRWIETETELVPADEDGLVMWSFYAHLTDIRNDLNDAGYDIASIFPVNFAYQPITPNDFQGAENAAYVGGTRSFILFPDALSTVPLAANAGVVRHEFGHSWFELLITGVAGGTDPTPTDAALNVRSLNEGFADMVASLTLDDPRFIDPSLPIPSRDVSGGATASPSLYASPSDAGLLSSFDPYLLGTVYASFVWDIRLATDDNAYVLEVVVEAIQHWGEQAALSGELAAYQDTDRFIQNVLNITTGVAHAAACDSANSRFPDSEFVGCN